MANRDGHGISTLCHDIEQERERFLLAMNLFFAKIQVRSARGFNRWTRLPQTITFKCLPRGRIWSTATTRWGLTPVASELSDLRLNAPFSQKNEGVYWYQKKSARLLKECFCFKHWYQQKVRRLSSPTYLFWGIGKSRSLSFFLSCNLRPGRWRLTADATREEDGGGCAEGEGFTSMAHPRLFVKGKGSIWLFTNLGW